MKEPEYTEQDFTGKTSDKEELLVEEIKKSTNLDNILIVSVGRFGLFQAWLLLVILLPSNLCSSNIWECLH